MVGLGDFGQWVARCNHEGSGISRLLSRSLCFFPPAQVWAQVGPHHVVLHPRCIFQTCRVCSIARRTLKIQLWLHWGPGFDSLLPTKGGWHYKLNAIDGWKPFNKRPISYGRQIISTWTDREMLFKMDEDKTNEQQQFPTCPCPCPPRIYTNMGTTWTWFNGTLATNCSLDDVRSGKGKSTSFC